MIYVVYLFEKPLEGPVLLFCISLPVIAKCRYQQEINHVLWLGMIWALSDQVEKTTLETKQTGPCY